jgi:hypothetical protein
MGLVWSTVYEDVGLRVQSVLVKCPRTDDLVALAHPAQSHLVYGLVV